jgi:pyruvate dehydrogenase (quinone)
MMLGELITLRQQRLPVKVVVFNNGTLSFVELEMKAAGIARSAGLFGARVEKAGTWRARCGRRPSTTGRPWWRCTPPGRSWPCRPSSPNGQIKGFTLHATRTILSGGGEELVEVARTNLRDLDIE